MSYYWHKKLGLKLQPIRLGKCSICNEVSKLVLDHNHLSGAPRGKICNKCNIGLGYFKDSIDNMQRAVEYIKYWSKN